MYTLPIDRRDDFMYKIVIDSCGELPENLKLDSHFCNVPLELEVDGFHIRALLSGFIKKYLFDYLL